MKYLKSKKNDPNDPKGISVKIASNDSSKMSNFPIP